MRKGYCHYNITGGKLQYHADSYHNSTQLVEMPDIPGFWVDTHLDGIDAAEPQNEKGWLDLASRPIKERSDPT